MAKNSVDLNILRKEIDVRKQERNIISSKLGETTVGTGVAPRETFLRGLLTSLNTGKDTASSNLIKLVENKVAIKNKETARHNVTETDVERIPARIPAPVHSAPVDMSPERDEQLWQDMEKGRKQTLAESLNKYIAPTTNTQARQPQQQMNLNEGYLVENVKKIVDNYLIENFGPVIEEAIKGTIIEMYAVERIKEVLQENREIVKSVVLETIREIQANSKKKAQA